MVSAQQYAYAQKHISNLNITHKYHCQRSLHITNRIW